MTVLLCFCANMRYFIFLAFLLAISLAKFNSPKRRIVGGSPTAANQFLYVTSQSLVGYTYSNGQICTSTLIASQWVLTAAHCITEFAPATGLYCITFTRRCSFHIYNIWIGGCCWNPRFKRWRKWYKSFRVPRPSQLDCFKLERSHIRRYGSHQIVFSSNQHRSSYSCNRSWYFFVIPVVKPRNWIGSWRRKFSCSWWIFLLQN